jgi:hypothetical protein
VTVRHRTVPSKGCLSNKTAIAMIFKLAEAAEKSWRRFDGHNQLPKVILGVKFTDCETDCVAGAIGLETRDSSRVSCGLRNAQLRQEIPAGVAGLEVAAQGRLFKMPCWQDSNSEMGKENNLSPDVTLRSTCRLNKAFMVVMDRAPDRLAPLHR